MLKGKSESSQGECPFYVMEAQKIVICESLIGTTCTNHFESVEKAKIHRHKYCYSKDRCADCIHYSALLYALSKKEKED